MSGASYEGILLSDALRSKIKDPLPKGRGISEPRELALLVQLPVARASSPDVGTGRLLVPVPADGAREIAVGPELAAPQPLRHFGAAPEDLARGQALDDRHQLGHALDAV